MRRITSTVRSVRIGTYFRRLLVALNWDSGSNLSVKLFGCC